MITINLQWLACPFVVLAIYWFAIGLYYFITSLGSSDIGPALGVASLVLNGTKAAVSGAIGFLIWMAFK